MAELFPELNGLKGGEKQAWINRNLDLISLLNGQLGFEPTRQVLKMKADTLASALQRAEQHHRPAVTRADRAYNLAQINEAKVNEVLKELSVQAEAISATADELGELKNNLTSYFTLMSQANEVMARLCQSTHTYFTEHTDSLNKRKVGLTTHGSHDRLALFSGRQSVSSHRPDEIRQRNTFKRRRYGV